MKKTLAILLGVVLLLGICGACAARPNDGAGSLDGVIADAAECVRRAAVQPAVGSVGGEWAVLGLARGGCETPQGYYEGYYAAAEEYLAARSGERGGIKSTEYSRLILALSAIGKDPRDVAGCDLTVPLGDYETTVRQGVNGAIWALIALDSRDYPIPHNPQASVQATRQMYVAHILACQRADGGWSLSDGDSEAPSDPDITAMALQALAHYQEQEDVAAATEAALGCLSGMQDAQGGFAFRGAANAGSCAQVICALCELGLETDDPRFVKNGNSVLDNLMTCYRPERGFLYTADAEEVNQMATEQGLYALVAVRRLRRGENSLYRMSDAVDLAASGAEPIQTEGGSIPTQNSDGQGACTLSISCVSLLDNMEKLDADKAELVPQDGWILPPTQVALYEGESVFDLLQRTCREEKIHLEFTKTPVYDSAYIEGIGNLYEFDCGERSGWVYQVNGAYSNYGCSRYTLQDGDVVCWAYTCDLGADVGGAE